MLRLQMQSLSALGMLVRSLVRVLKVQRTNALLQQPKYANKNNIASANIGRELWKRNDTVVILDETVRSAEDPVLEVVQRHVRYGKRVTCRDQDGKATKNFSVRRSRETEKQGKRIAR